MPQSLSNMMTPVLALVVWTMVILVWLYLRRIPAMRKAGIDPAKIKGSESYASMPPLNPKAVWVSDNYNHLHEQPVIFYALCVYTHLVGVWPCVGICGYKDRAQPDPGHDELCPAPFRSVQSRFYCSCDHRRSQRAGTFRDLARPMATS
jgi:hypothetical protein